MSDPFVGEIKTLGFGFAPRGYSLCAGQVLPINQNQALFSLIGTNFGGDGIQSFKLPDLRGRAAIGQGQGAGLQPYTLGQAIGAETVQVTVNNLPPHTHSSVFQPPTFTPPTATTTINAFTAPTSRQTSPANALLTGAADGSGAPVNVYSTAGTAATLGSGAATTRLTGGGVTGGSVQIGQTGSGIPLSVVQPVLAITYAIATTGIFPSRN